MKISKGEKAPDFTLTNTTGKLVSLSDFLNDGVKNIIILFFPFAFSGVCSDELCKVRDNMKLYNSLNVLILGISIDSFFTLREFKQANNLNFTLLSDFNKEVSKRYGVLDNDYFGMKGVSKRSAFVIGDDGTVKYAEILEDSDNQPDFKAIQKALKA